jgi:hypothetical protein
MAPSVVEEAVTDPSEFVVHQSPIWRERSNFVINAPLRGDGRSRKFEQLFVRRIADDRFEVCCIPFFLYDVALGDTVVTSPEGDRKYVVKAVVDRSGRYVFRVWFGESFHPRQEVAEELESLGCLLEWSSRNLLAVDVAGEKSAQVVANFLAEGEQVGRLVYETGRS